MPSPGAHGKNYLSNRQRQINATIPTLSRPPTYLRIDPTNPLHRIWGSIQTHDAVQEGLLEVKRIPATPTRADYDSLVFSPKGLLLVLQANGIPSNPKRMRHDTFSKWEGRIISIIRASGKRNKYDVREQLKEEIAAVEKNIQDCEKLSKPKDPKRVRQIRKYFLRLQYYHYTLQKILDHY